MATGRRPTEFPDDNHTEHVLDRADALLSRNRPAGLPLDTVLDGPSFDRNDRKRELRSAGQPTEFPVLTEVVASPPKPPSAQDLMLDQIENELRLELLNQLGPELERLIEARVHAKLDEAIESVMGRARDKLVTEVRRATREVLGQVIGDEIKRLREAQSPER